MKILFKSCLDSNLPVEIAITNDGPCRFYRAAVFPEAAVSIVIMSSVL